MYEQLEKEINAAIRKADGTAAWRELEVNIRPFNSDTLIVELSQMYEYVKLNFGVLQAVAEVLGTDFINVGSQDFFRGCDTCDYGSSYRIELYAKGSPLQKGVQPK